MWIVTSQEMKQIEARAVEYGHSYEGMMENAGAAAALLSIVPPILLYLSMQKYFIKGIADGAVKG